MIEKGTISSIKGNRAVVLPQGGEDVSTAELSVPERLRERIRPQTWVVYAAFDDNTGVILELLDG